jgi:ADP-ribose pyrophosphatase YjhB (NUDIX family)
MLLVKRKFDPHPDWWVLGDMMMLPGESPEKTAQRVLEQMAGLKIEDDKRSKFIDFNFCVWGKRKEPLQENGCHLMAVTMSVIVTDEEAARIALSGDFSDPTWVSPQNVVLKPPFPLHQAVRRIAQAFLISVQTIGK